MKLCKDCFWFRRNWLNNAMGFQKPSCARPGLSTDMVYGKVGYRPCDVERDSSPPIGCGVGAQHWVAK